MKREEFRKLLAGLSISTLLAGAGLTGTSYTHAAQGG